MEKNSKNKKNYVVKRLNDKKEEHDFYFLRWLAEINKNEKDTDYVCQMIILNGNPLHSPEKNTFKETDT